VLLRNVRNRGFSGAHNQGIELALSRWGNQNLDRRYILITNPDLEFSPTAIRVLISYMEAHPEVGTCGPKLLRAVARTDADLEMAESSRTDMIDSTGLQIKKSRRVVDRGAGEPDSGQYDNADDVFGLSGACVLYRASVLAAAKVGTEYFDEDFFAYLEDVDLAWRVRSLGFEARLVPQAVAWHYRRVPSSPRHGWFASWSARRSRSPFVNFLSTRNRGWMIIKNDRVIDLIHHLPWWLPYECAKLFASLLSMSQIKGQIASLVGMPKMLWKRSKIRKTRRAKGQEMRRWFV
jgi:GT2 family glycosyltransferase